MELLGEEYNKIIKYIANNKSPGSDILNEITPHIFISSEKISNDIGVLKDNKIKYVLNLGASRPKDIYKKFKKHKIIDLQISYDNVFELFKNSYHLIQNIVIENKKILIHCELGITESPAIVINYILRRAYMHDYNESKLSLAKNINKFKLFDIIKFVHMSRPCITLSDNIIRQLLVIESQIKDQLMNEVGDYDSSECDSTSESSDQNYDDITDMYNVLSEVALEKDVE